MKTIAQETVRFRRGKTARKIPAVLVRTKHRNDCPKRGDYTYNRCTCPKILKYCENGVAKIVSAQTGDVEDAERQAYELESRFRAAAEGKPLPDRIEQVKIEDAVKGFIQNKRDVDITKISIYGVEYVLNRLVEFCHSKNLLHVSEVKLTHLEEWRSSWKMEAGTKQNYQKRVKAFFAHCLKRELISKNPAFALDSIKNTYVDEHGERREGRKPTLALTESQYAQILETVWKVNGEITDEQRQKMYALILLMRWSGLAIRDALMLERTHLEGPDADGWYKLFLRRHKTGTAVYCGIQPEVAVTLFALNGNSRYFFWDGKVSKDVLVQTWVRLFQKISAIAKLNDEQGSPMRFHSHTLRDTFAVGLFNRGVSIEDVAQLLGHSNILITQSHYSPWIQSRADRLMSVVKGAYSGPQAVAAASLSVQ